MSSYLIPNHVYLCKTSDGVVFLNLRKDKYLGIGGEELSHLRPLIAGWPVAQVAEATLPMHSRACQIAAELHRAGLLTMDKTVGKMACPPELQQAESSILEQPAKAHPRTSAFLLARIAYAAAIVSSILRFRSLEGAVNRIRSRRYEHRAPPGSETTTSIVALTLTFFRLRPLLYSSRNRCLYDCLVLHEFLSGFGSVPAFVLGVTTFPFKAHCWLQAGPEVLTDYWENTRRYTPILVA